MSKTNSRASQMLRLLFEAGKPTQTAAIPSIGDTDRSIPRPSTTIVWPTATIMIVTESASMNAMLLDAPNCGCIAVQIAKSPRMASRSWTSRRRNRSRAALPSPPADATGPVAWAEADRAGGVDRVVI